MARKLDLVNEGLGEEGQQRLTEYGGITDATSCLCNASSTRTMLTLVAPSLALASLLKTSPWYGV